MNQEFLTETPSKEFIADQVDLRPEFTAIRNFYDWYESHGERRAGLPPTSLEQLYTDLHVFESYARSIGHEVDKLENKWRRMALINPNAAARTYVRMGVHNIVLAHIHLTTLFSFSIIDDLRIQDGLKLVAHYEEEDREVLRKAAEMIPGVREKYDRIHREFHSQDDASEHTKADLLPIEEARKHEAKNEKQVALDKQMNGLIKEYKSFESVIRQRRASLNELLYCKKLLTDMLGIRSDVQKYLEQSVKLLEKVTEARSCERGALGDGCFTLAQHFEQRAGTEMEEFFRLNRNLKAALKLP